MFFTYFRQFLIDIHMFGKFLHSLNNTVQKITGIFHCSQIDNKNDQNALHFNELIEEHPLEQRFLQNDLLGIENYF